MAEDRVIRIPIEFFTYDCPDCGNMAWEKNRNLKVICVAPHCGAEMKLRAGWDDIPTDEEGNVLIVPLGESPRMDDAMPPQKLLCTGGVRALSCSRCGGPLTHRGGGVAGEYCAKCNAFDPYDGFGPMIGSASPA